MPHKYFPLVVSILNALTILEKESKFYFYFPENWNVSQKLLKKNEKIHVELLSDTLAFLGLFFERHINS